MKTLEQLKVENAELENETGETPVIDPEDNKGEAVDDKPQDPENLAEGEQEGGEESETDAWMQTDGEPSSDDEKKFTDHDIAAAKKKLKARVSYCFLLII